MKAPISLLFVASLIAPAQTQTVPDKPQANTLICRNVHVVTGTPGKVLAEQNVLIGDRKIIAVAADLPAEWPKDATTIDGTGCYLSPGFVDAHAHLPRLEPGVSEEDLRRVYADYVRFGVLHLRSMRGLEGDPLLRARIQNGDWLGPDLYLSAPPISSRNLPPLEKAPAWLSEQKDLGFDAIKCLSGLDGEALSQWVRLSHDLGLQWLGHAPTSGLEGCLQAGVNGVEHISPFVRTNLKDPEAFPKLLTALGEISVNHSGNLLYYQRLSHRIPIEKLQALPGVSSSPQAWKDQWIKDLKAVQPKAAAYGKMVDDYMALHPALTDSNIRILISPSAGPFIVPGHSYMQEIRLLAQAGLTPTQIWQAATTTAYAAMNLDHRLGQVQPGFDANLVLLANNPFEKIEAMAQVNGVFLRGTWHPF